MTPTVSTQRYPLAATILLHNITLWRAVAGDSNDAHIDTLAERVEVLHQALSDTVAGTPPTPPTTADVTAFIADLDYGHDLFDDEIEEWAPIGEVFSYGLPLVDPGHYATLVELLADCAMPPALTSYFADVPSHPAEAA